MLDLPDEGLVARLRQGDSAAWEEFLDRYERLIYAVPRRMGLDRDQSADVFQDVAVAFLRGLPRLRDVRTIPRWLTRTAYRIARDRQRRRRREVRPDDETFWGRVPDAAPEVEIVLDGFRAREQVAWVLQRIPGRCRALLELLFLTDPAPSYAEIAKQLVLPVGSLGPTRRRCLERALEALAEAGIRNEAGSTLTAEPPPVRTVSRRRT